MEKEIKFKEAIDTLASSTESWLRIRKILLDEIESHQAIITYIDKLVKEREDKSSKLN